MFWRSFFSILLLCQLPFLAIAQTDTTWGYVTATQADSLKQLAETVRNDTLRMAAFRSLGFYYQTIKLDSAFYFHEKQIALAKKLNMRIWEADGLSQAGYTQVLSGNFIRSYEYISAAKKIAGDKASESDNWRPWTFSNATNSHEARIAVLAMSYQMSANLWGALEEEDKRIASCQEALKLAESIQNGKIIFIASGGIARKRTPDSAIAGIKKAIDIGFKAGYYRVGFTYQDLAVMYLKKKMLDSALIYAQYADERSRKDNELLQLPSTYKLMSDIFWDRKMPDSSFFYARKSYNTARTIGSGSQLQIGYRSLADAYERIKNIDSAYKYERLAGKLRDSLNLARMAELTQYQKFSFNEQLRLKKLDEERTANANRMKMLGLIALAGLTLLVAMILYRNNRQKQKANAVLQTTLSDLKSTQAQLIQSEKMASLGELTAGIAHEIQNPLNFVNNFSEVSAELIHDMKEEFQKGDTKEGLAIAEDIQQNLSKILHHGKRADAIVKGMLQHSRTGSGVKEPTDINALADEYLRLAYHGLKAKDKSFNAQFHTDFDNTVGTVDVVPQDIGRVLLNLISNAFYAVNEKKKKLGDGYAPEVTVSTRLISQSANQIIISVRDNGNGIPDTIRNKIFQPFFTTKPTGEGTGLGLSLSYDIVKAHGGEIRVESKEGEGSTFMISLPG